jgi:hypothetical protein
LLAYKGLENNREVVTGLPVNRIATADCSQQMTRRYIPSNQRRESGVIGMEKSSEVGHELTRSLVRDLVNKLAVIVGHCDLLSEHLKESSQSAKHVGAIHEIAQEMAKELKEYQYRLAESARSAGFQELDVA